jgi:hypothetical protein
MRVRPIGLSVHRCVSTQLVCMPWRSRRLGGGPLRLFAKVCQRLAACMSIWVCLRPQALAQPLYKAVHARLVAQDQDQEVKEAAISCMATAVAALGDLLQKEVPQVGSNRDRATRLFIYLSCGSLPCLSMSLYWCG